MKFFQALGLLYQYLSSSSSGGNNLPTDTTVKDIYVGSVAAAPGTCIRKAGFGVIRMTKGDCRNLHEEQQGTILLDHADDWMDCQLDFCDASMGTLTGMSYAPAAVGTCNERMAYGIIQTPKADCKRMGGKWNTPDANEKDSDDVWIMCYLDWCNTAAGTTTGVVYLPNKVGSCADKVGYGIVPMYQKVCDEMGGAMNKGDAAPLPACHLDWCAVTDRSPPTRPAAVGTCVSQLGRGAIKLMRKSNCERMGGVAVARDQGEVCELDWCDANHGTTTSGSGYVVAAVGTCRQEVGYGVIEMTKANCRRLGGNWNSDKNRKDPSVAIDCQLSFCDAEAGTLNGLGYQSAAIGSCKKKAGTGAIEMEKHNCNRVGGMWSAEDNSKTGFETVLCFLDLCSEKTLPPPMQFVSAPKGSCVSTINTWNPVQMIENECRQIGGLSPTKDTGNDEYDWLDCGFDWCDARKGTKTGSVSYVSAAVSTCYDWVGHGIIQTPKKHCRRIGGAWNTADNDKAANALVACHLDWCNAAAGTTTGTGYVLGSVGSCAKKAATGVAKIPKGDCSRLGGVITKPNYKKWDVALVACRFDVCSQTTLPPPFRLAAVDTCVTKVGSGPIRTPKGDCKRMGGRVNRLDERKDDSLWIQCELDWCDSQAGTSSMGGYVSAAVGSCNDKVGYGIVEMEKRYCRLLGGAWNTPDNRKNGRARIACHLDWCSATAGTTNGVGYVSAAVGTCGNKIGQGRLEVPKSHCSRMGGIWKSKYSRCVVDWCSESTAVALLP